MPESTHPPYESGALTTPRQLQRWLDVNPQNGALTRTKTFITIPAFNIPITWNGYSEIVGEYHFEAAKNLSLKIPNNGDLLPSNPNYTLCVSYVNSDNSVVRYSLWRAPNDVIFDETILPYTGQLIKKNFRIEIWSTNVDAVVDIYDTIIYTSVLGSVDYRYGTDSPLVNPDALCEGQQNVSGTTTLDLNTDSLILWLDPGDSGVPLPDGTLWIDRVAGINLTGNGTGFAVAEFNIFELIDSQKFTSTASLDGIKELLLFFRMGNVASPASTTLLSINTIGLFQISVGTTGILTVTLNATNTVSIPGIEYGLTSQEYILSVTTSVTDGTTMTLYKANGLGIITSAHTSVGVDIPDGAVFEVGNAGNSGTNFFTRGCLVYNTVLDDNSYQLALQYLASSITYDPLNHAPTALILPLMWGACAAPTLNQ